jgi:prepilin-type N-terminal cleavage/methylation domain-containing protein
VVLYDVRSGSAFPPLKDHAGKVTSVAFAPDDKTLASTSYDGTVKLWNVATRRAALTIIGHTGPVTQATFSPDGKLMAATGADGTVRYGPPSASVHTLNRLRHRKTKTKGAELYDHSQKQFIQIDFERSRPVALWRTPGEVLPLQRAKAVQATSRSRGQGGVVGSAQWPGPRSQQHRPLGTRSGLPTRMSAFTLIELLVVIAIIAIWRRCSS